MTKKILFDAEYLISKYTKNNARSGIFFVANNILLRLAKNKNFKIYLYFDNYEQLISNYSNFLKDDDYKKFEIYDNFKIKNISKLTELEKKINILKERKKIEKNFIKKFFIKFKIFFYKKNKKLLGYTNIKKTKEKNNCDIYISPIFKFPESIIQNKKIKKYIFLYDTIPYIFPEICFKTIKQEDHWYTKMINSLDKSTYCFCISEQTKKDFLKYCGDRLDENKMFVMPIATAQDFYPDKDEKKLKAVLDKYNISQNQRGKYIFSLCTLEPRKNLIFTIKCFIEFIKENKIDDLYFYLGGGHWNDFIEQLEKEIYDLDKYKDKIVKLGYVDDEDVNTLYSNSLFFTYISLYEGFGMPPLEAMSCGTPVLTSNTSSLPEVVGDAAIMIDPTDKKACIDAMKNLYFNENLRNELSKKGLEQAKKFSWEKSTKIIIDSIKKQS